MHHNFGDFIANPLSIAVAVNKQKESRNKRTMSIMTCESGRVALNESPKENCKL